MYLNSNIKLYKLEHYSFFFHNTNKSPNELLINQLLIYLTKQNIENRTLKWKHLNIYKFQQWLYIN